MIINSLDKMEKIVSGNSNLSWVGWDIADRKKSDSARTSPSGVRVNNEWFLQKIYKVDRNGWDIPNKYKV
jgi:hypothetical protein